uniref:Uncharacterized protein n=1 Tax=Amphimedon queenslandica TaxID=400682 RepID=A0A1X7TIV6_AMPQE
TTTTHYSSVSTATPSVSVTPSISNTSTEATTFSIPSVSSIHSDSVIALGVSVGALLILFTVSVTINICCFIRMKDSFTMSKDS